MKRLSVETSSSPAAVDGIDPLTSNKEQNQKKRRKQNDNTHVNDKTKDQREKDGLEQKTQQQQQDEKRNTAATNSCTRDDVPSEHLHQKHALADWSKIEAMLQGKKLAIFLDCKYLARHSILHRSSATRVCLYIACPYVVYAWYRMLNICRYSLTVQLYNACSWVRLWVCIETGAYACVDDVCNITHFRGRKRPPIPSHEYMNIHTHTHPYTPI